MELSTEDKQRIEQEAKRLAKKKFEIYTQSMVDALIEFAEYATIYEREQWKEWRTEAEGKMIEYGKFVSDVEAERSELLGKIEFWKQQDQAKLIKIAELRDKLHKNGFLND